MDEPDPALAAFPALPSPDGPALPPPLPRPAAVVPMQAYSDEHLVAFWL